MHLKGGLRAIHQLKTEPDYFKDITSGKKSFEVRINDREFQKGDFLALNEVGTGRCCLLEIVYIMEDPRYIKEGYVILGTRPCIIGRHAEKFTMYSPDMFYRAEVY